MDIREFSFDFEGTPLVIKKSILAGQANGAVLASLGETTVLATAVMSKNPNESAGYFPLSVDFEEKFYAGGKIKGSRFIKREGRASDKAILTARLIDRTLRPLFNHAIRHNIQVVVTALSLDHKNDPAVPALIAASCALRISNIPWAGPVGAVRVGMKDGKLAIHMPPEEQKASNMDILFAGTAGKINMMEGDGKEVPEQTVVEAFLLAQKHIDALAQFQEDVAKHVGVSKRELEIPSPDSEFAKQVEDFLGDEFEAILYAQEDKLAKAHKLDDFKEKLSAHIAQTHPDQEDKIKYAHDILEEKVNAIVHRNIIAHDRRPDGRKSDMLRALDCTAPFLPRTHGSGLFIRGETQVLSVLTLGAPGDKQLIDTMEGKEEKHFMHHYNFPAFSVGETKPMRGPSRRDIGHGALAERALRRLLPAQKDFPYTIRLVSETLSSNGSSSMASICASVLALADGGVPIEKMSAGIAMGLMSDQEGNYKVLTDIQGPEDHHGDMDLKVAGTTDGVTALQMDVKIGGITAEIFKDTLAQAKKARLEILNAMRSAIAEPRKELSPYAPRIVTLQINPEKIGNVIGPGGKIINKIIDETGVSIDIEEDGTVFISSTEQKGMQEAVDWVRNLTQEPEIGKIYQATVKKIMDFGAFVEIFPGTEGLVHISKIADRRIDRVEDVLKVGDVVPVKLMEIDGMGRLNLSIRDAK